MSTEIIDLDAPTVKPCSEDEKVSDLFRLTLVVGIGGIVCLTGIFLNSCLLVVFSRIRIRKSNLIYLVVLALFDIAVEVSFIMIFIVSHIYDYFHIYNMYLLWHSYVVPVSTIGQTLIAASSGIIVAASVDRYSASSGRPFKRRHRLIAIGIAVLIACLTRITVFIELFVDRREECDGFSYVHVVPSEFAKDPIYNKVYMFWTRNVVNVFLPFILLIFFNWKALKMTKQRKGQDLLMECPPLMPSPPSHPSSLLPSSLKDASRTLIALVSSHLLTNTLNFVITVVEHISFDTFGEHPLVYRYLSDLSSVLAVTGTAVRLPVYYATNGIMRRHLDELFSSSSTVPLETPEKKSPETM